MQPTTLNKVISLFLVGGLVLLLLSFILWNLWGPPKLSDWMVHLVKHTGTGFVAFVGSLVTVSLAAVLGIFCEALTDLTIRELLKRGAKWKWFVSFLRRSRMLRDHNFWRDRFRASIEEEENLRKAVAGYRERSAVVGFFYAFDPNEFATAWLESHYATYIFASNLAFLSMAFQLWSIVAGFLGLYPWPAVTASIGITAIVFYASCCLAFDRYLHTYQFAFRHATLILRTKKAETAPTEPPR